MVWAIAFPIAALPVSEAWLLRALAIGLVFGLIVFVHELGHFLTARLSGMAVYEFSLGFGRPLLFWFRRGETQYSIRLWPFISYVRIAGMEPGDDHPQGFDKKPRWVGAIVLVTGCLMNFALAVVIFVAMGLAIGKAIPSNRVEGVISKTPAAMAHLQPGDRIIGVGGRAGLRLEEIRAAIRTHPGQRIVLLVQRGHQRLNVPVTPMASFEPEVTWFDIIQKPVGMIGITFAANRAPIGALEAISTGFDTTLEAIKLQTAGIIGMVRRKIPTKEARGPVGIVSMLNEEAKKNWLSFLNVAALLTVAIGFLNLLPVPPLDGSRLLILALEGMLRRSFDKRKELVVHLVGMALLLALAAALTYKDIARIAAGGG